MKRRIVILTLDHSRHFTKVGYLLNHLAHAWVKKGIEVKVVQGTRQQVEADIVISHVDLTIIPKEYTEYMQNYPVAINSKVTDISKSLISQNLLATDDDYDGKVIVKTAANYGGVPEAARAHKTGNSQTSAGSEQRWKDVKYLDSHHYPRFNSIKEVPDEIWGNDKLIVERFLPEIDSAGSYCLRKFYFLGDKEFGIFQTSTNPIIKFAEVRNEVITEVPEELRVMRDSIGADYGRFDYAIVDGKTVIYDLNTTPNIGRSGLELLGSRLSEFAGGLKFFFNS